MQLLQGLSTLCTIHLLYMTMLQGLGRNSSPSNSSPGASRRTSAGSRGSRSVRRRSSEAYSASIGTVDSVSEGGDADIPVRRSAEHTQSLSPLLEVLAAPGASCTSRIPMPCVHRMPCARASHASHRVPCPSC